MLYDLRMSGARFIVAIVVAGCSQPTPSRSPDSPPPPPSATRATDDAEKAPAIAIEDVACEPNAPAWEIALAEGYAWGLLYAGDFDGTRAARERASKLVDALPTNDARYVEAHCRAAFAHHNLMQVGRADRHFRRALEAGSRRAPSDPERRFASASLPAFSVAVSWTFEKKAPHHVQLDRTVLKSLDPEDCRTADVAFLELARANLYRAATTKQLREVPQPKRRRLGTLAADTGASLQDRIVEAFGPRHRFTIGIREHMTGLCEDDQHRKFPDRCPPLAELRRRTYADRMEVLGERDPDTRRAALFLGGDHLAEGRVEEATKLFEQAGGGEPDEVWVAAHQLLAGLEFDRSDDRRAFLRLQNVMAALPRAGIDFEWTIAQAWRLYQDAAKHVGDEAEAKRAKRELTRLTEHSYYVGPGGPSVGMIALTRTGDAAIFHETAVLGLVESRTLELQRHDLTAEGRAWRSAELDLALQCSALLRHRNGDHEGTRKDLEALTDLRSQG